MRIAVAVTLALLALAAARPAAAQSMDSAQPGLISQILHEDGYKAAIETDSGGNPVIRSAAQGVNFSIYFYGCREGRDCTSVQFSSGFRMRDPLSPDQVNDWNGRKRFARAWRDSDGNAFLRMDVLVSGGLGEENFRQQFKLWTVLLNDYVAHIGWRS
ncbi:MAG: hypothetical protein KatS3mg118_3661 [Paracoccaceae bacterium]|nr:MAG: hypothetical protein KatS3mg118_3661 [Paracoccaceae bacterium]